MSKCRKTPSCPRPTRRSPMRGKSPPDASGCPGIARLRRRPESPDPAKRGGRRPLPRRNPHPPPRQPGPHPHGNGVPHQPGARTPRREPPARELPHRNSRPAPHRGHGLRRLLRPRRPTRRHPPGPAALKRLCIQPPHRLRSRREHRVGHAEPGDAAGNRRSLGALPRTPGEHPQCALQRHSHRRIPAPPDLHGPRPGRSHLHAGLRRDNHGRSGSL